MDYCPKTVSFKIYTVGSKQIIKTSLGMTYELGFELAQEAIEFLCFKTMVQSIHTLLELDGNFNGEFTFIYKPL